MSLRNYRITVGADGASRDFQVTSPTDVQAGDAAASLMKPGEAILEIEEISTSEGLSGEPPLSQAGELASETPGFAKVSKPRPGEVLDDGQEEVFVREEFETGRLEHHAGEEVMGDGPDRDRLGAVPGTGFKLDAGERNRGLGQTIVGEVGPGADQRPLDPAAGGPGSGAGAPAPSSAWSDGSQTTSPHRSGGAASMSDTSRTEPPASAGGQLHSGRSRRMLWLFVIVIALGAVACGIVWANWTKDSARTGPREVQSDEMRLSAPAAATGATPRPDAPTTSTGEPAPNRPGTDPNVNDPGAPVS